MVTKPRSAVLALIGCGLLIAALTAVTPDPENDLRRSYVDGGIGEWISAREFDARVSAVRTSRVIQPDEYRDPIHSTATFVVVSADLRSRAKDQLNATEIEACTTDGRTYHPREGFTGAQPPIVPPGFTGSGQWVFELPDERVAATRLVIGPSSNAFDWYDLAVRVDLDLESAATGSTPIALAEPTLVVTR